MNRCSWAESNPLETDYHDTEWGVAVYDDRLLFELLILEGAQSGLSWATILTKRAGYKEAFDNFDAMKISKYDDAKISALITDTRIVRHKMKINATVTNAKCFLAIQQEYGSFREYIWSFVGNKPVINAWETVDKVPVSSPAAIEMSKSLKKKGFKFVGPTTCYAFMQAVGMVNDHVISCFRYKEVCEINMQK